MHEFIQFALLGLGAGAVYGLVAQGIVLIYRASGVVNFAQGALAMVGTYTYFELRNQLSWGFTPAFVVAVLFAALIGAAIYSGILRQMRLASPLAKVVATLGVLTILEAAGTIRYQDNATAVGYSLPNGRIKPFGVAITQDRLWLLGIAVVITAVLWAFSRFTPMGRATSAVAENEVAAASLGWSPDRIATANWALGSGLAAAAGILIAPMLGGVTVLVMTLLVIPGLAAALTGGMTSYPAALVGGVVIGVLQSEISVHQASGSGWDQAVPFLAITALLVIRGKALPLRGYIIERLPALGSGRGPLVPVIGAAIAFGVLFHTLFNDDWVADFTVSMTAAIFLLSVTVVTGYAGQLSLAQFALGGFGALFAGRLVVAGVPFELAIVIGILGTTVVGLALALPALRTRGVNLAVVTLGLGLAAQAVVFNNPDYIGGTGGTQVGPQKFFGLDVDYLFHADNYGLMVLLFLVLAALVVGNVRRSSSGRRMIAVRTNERAAASLGISVVGAKLYAFGVGAAIAGLAGILYAFRGRSFLYADFDPLHSITAVTLAVVGGVGYLSGAILGSTLAAGGVGLLITQAIVGDRGNQWLILIGGVFVILILLQDPDGMASHQAKAFNALVNRIRRRSATPPVEVELPQGERKRVAPRPLVVENLTVRFGGVVAVRDLNLSVNPGEVVGLIGPNGAGKTTAIEAITGFVRPAAGSVTFDGASIDGFSAYKRARAGLTRSFQSLELFGDVSVYDNLRAASDPRAKAHYLTDLVRPRKDPLPPAAVAAIHEFGLAADLHVSPEQLPYGRQRLVGIARSVATEPSVLLLDEPAAGLSETESAELGTLVRRLADEWGIGVLLVEHDVELVMRVCDRITVLNFGSEIASGTPEAIRRDPAVIAAYLGSSEEVPAEVSAGGDVVTNGVAGS